MITPGFAGRRSLPAFSSVGGIIVRAGTLTSTFGGLVGTTKQWLRNGVPISGATGTSYTLSSADVGYYITFSVSDGTTTKVSSPVGPIELTDSQFFAKGQYVCYMNEAQKSNARNRSTGVPLGRDLIKGTEYENYASFDYSTFPVNVHFRSKWPTTYYVAGVWCYNALSFGDAKGSIVFPALSPQKVSNIGSMITTGTWSQVSGDDNFNILEEVWLTPNANDHLNGPFQEIGFFYHAPAATVSFHNSGVLIGTTYTDPYGTVWTCREHRVSGHVDGYWTFLKTATDKNLATSVRDWKHALTWLAANAPVINTDYYVNGIVYGEEVCDGGGERELIMSYDKTAWSAPFTPYYSAAMTDWIVYDNGSYVVNNATSPVGTTTASKFTENTTVNVEHSIGKSAAYSATITPGNYQASVNVKRLAGTRNVTMSLFDGTYTALVGANFENLGTQTGVNNFGWGSNFVFQNGYYVDIGSGWVKIVMNFQVVNAITGINPRLLPMSGTTTYYTGDGTSALGFYGFNIISVDGPTAPAGYDLVVDTDGNYVVDDSANYYIVAS